MPVLQLAWTALLSILMKLLAAAATKDFLEWALFHVAEQIVSHTETRHDDEWFYELKKAYNLKRDGG